MSLRLFILLLIVLALLAPLLAYAQTPAVPTWVINQAQCAAAVVPSDTANLPTAPAPCVGTSPTKGIYVAGTSTGTACTLQVALQDGTSLQFQNVQPGAVLPIRAQRVYATGTNCTAIIALY